VTGATGTVGGEVVKQLAAISSSSGHKIRAAVHSKNKTGQLGDKRVEIWIIPSQKLLHML
jgi:uncharacterized protein YbjT (DUF2867 family)